MRIALVAPVEETVPPQFYGGTEWIVYHLANGMGLRGHEVDLFTAANSPINKNYTIIPIATQSLRATEPYASNLKMRETAKYLALTDAVMYASRKKYDIIHNHCSWRFLLYKDLINQKVLTTHHGPLNLDYQNLVFNKYWEQPYVSISNNQRRDLPHLNYVDTVYNGVDLADYPPEFSPTRPYSNMLFLARMSEEKGALEACMATHQAGKKLIIATKIDQVNQAYFETVKTHIDGTEVQHIGEVNLVEKADLLRKARALLVPIRWEEPFGLMFTEAMASGTPVITFARGAAPEIVVDGKTGFLVNESAKFIRGDFIIKKTGVAGLVEAIQRMYSMTTQEYIEMREASRARVEEKFTIQHMVDGYENVYKQLL